MIEKLSVRTPTGEVKLKVMKEIAKEFQIDWDTTESEMELLKPAEECIVRSLSLSFSLAHAQQVTYFKLKFIVPSEFTYFLYDQEGPDTFFSASSLPVKHVPVQCVEQNRPRTR